MLPPSKCHPLGMGMGTGTGTGHPMPGMPCQASQLGISMLDLTAGLAPAPSDKVLKDPSLAVMLLGTARWGHRVTTAPSAGLCPCSEPWCHQQALIRLPPAWESVLKQCRATVSPGTKRSRGEEESIPRSHLQHAAPIALLASSRQRAEQFGDLLGPRNWCWCQSVEGTRTLHSSTALSSLERSPACIESSVPPQQLQIESWGRWKYMGSP